MKSLCYLFFFLMISTGLRSHEPDLLKSTDIQKIMKQILEHHVEKKEITGQVLNHALIEYIDQFDPNKIYLLEQEILPYTKLSPQRLNELLEQYKNGNFSIFRHLNDLIQKSIYRAREIRKNLEKSSGALFQLIPKEKASYNNQVYAQNEDELKERQLSNLEEYILTQRKMYSDAIVSQKRNKIFQSYERQLKEFENQYLFQDDLGRSLPQAEQENLFTIHVLKALASSLDAHTSFYQTNEAYDMRVRLQKEFEGIGLVLKDKTEGIVVTHILPDAPAAKSGLIKEQDMLIEVDGKKVSEYPFDKVMDMLHDSKKAEVVLTFMRKGELGEENKIFTIKLKREVIILNNDRVDIGYQDFGNGIIGTIALHAFYQGEDISSEKDVKNAIEKLQKKGNLKGLILDLRDNSGGFLSQAIKVASLFITNGIIVISKYSDGDEKIYRDVDGKATYSGPLVILTSKMTASAAEIVAQALQDYGVALVVGDEHTYGKGTIQTQTVTDNQSSSYFKVTVGKYYTVSGKTPQKEGVKADIIVPGPLNSEKIGEEYLDSPGSDRIPSEYDDSLSDISKDVRSWYLKYYIPKLQHRKTEWRNMLPQLKKNSEYRIANNKNYQFFLKGVEAPSDESDESEEDELEGVTSTKKKNFGEDDLQMQEALNIVKDMILIKSLEISSDSKE